MSAYIYKTVEIKTRIWMFTLYSGAEHDEILNEMNASGWELVSSNSVGMNSFVERLVLTFRRPGDQRVFPTS